MAVAASQASKADTATTAQTANVAVEAQEARVRTVLSDEVVNSRWIIENVRIVPGGIYHAWIGQDIEGLEELTQTYTLNRLTKPLTVLAFFHPPIPKLFHEFLELSVRSFHLNERNYNA
jgi:hypothetical protein